MEPDRKIFIVEGGTCRAAAVGGGEVFQSRAIFGSRPSHRTLRARVAVAREARESDRAAIVWCCGPVTAREAYQEALKSKQLTRKLGCRTQLGI